MRHLSHFAAVAFRRRSSAVQIHGDQMAAPEHDPEKWAPVFRNDHAQKQDVQSLKALIAWGSAACFGRV
jgi:hypothetical protein